MTPGRAIGPWSYRTDAVRGEVPIRRMTTTAGSQRSHQTGERASGDSGAAGGDSSMAARPVHVRERPGRSEWGGGVTAG
jgi:hypothetical protein